MRFLVLGGGMQGRAVVFDLARRAGGESVTCADAAPRSVAQFLQSVALPGVRLEALDAQDPQALRRCMGGGYDVVVDMLPLQFVRPVCEAAIEVGVHLVNTYYDHAIVDLADRIERAGLSVLPEMGLDPGVDLVLAGQAVREFQAVTAMDCYGAGIPEPAAIDNPLKYKISWSWPGVLSAYCRPARLVRDGRVVELSDREIFDERHVRPQPVPGLGTLEAYPNGDAVRYAERLGILGGLQRAGRYSLRWPGHAALWRALKELGFLDEAPVPGLAGVTPRQFLTKHLEPRLQYQPGQRDIACLLVVVEGTIDDQPVRQTASVVDYKDPATGLTAMSRTVGFPASIAARMIASGAIRRRGLLSPLRDVPAEPFLGELRQRGVEVRLQREMLRT